MTPVWLLLLCFQMEHSPAWSQWRGPHGDGTTTGLMAPTAETAPKRIWQVPVGDGYGGPVLAAGFAVVLTSEPGKEVVTAVTLDTGDVQWRHTYPVAFKPNAYATRYGAGPFTTPLVVGDRVITVGVTGRVTCLSLSDGTVYWTREGEKDLTGDRELFCGHSASPMTWDGGVVVHTGNETGGRLVLLDPTDGRVRGTWTKDVPGYATPVAARLGGQSLIVALSQNGCTGLNPATAQDAFHIPFQVTWRENIVDPVVHGDLVVLTGREKHATTAYRIAPGAEGLTAAEAWRNTDVYGYIASSVVHGGRLYGLSHADKGRLVALRLADGASVWQGPARLGLSAALVVSGDQLWVVTAEGRLLVYNLTGKEPVLQADHPVATGGTLAHPAFAGPHLILKESATLVRLYTRP